MRIIVDGREREVMDGSTVEDLITELGEPRDHIIVEVNGRMIRPAGYRSVPLAPGDKVEIVHPAFGG